MGQALLTVLIGVATFVTGQIVVKLFDPIFELRSLFGEIARDLLLYENRDDRIAEPQKRLLIFRSLAAASHEKIGAFSLFRIVPPKDDARTASMLLLSLSNCQVAKPEEIGPIYRPAFGNLVGMFLIPSRLSNECGRLFSTILDL